MDFELLLEAEKRGILPADKKALLDEARSRGLIGGAPQAQPAQAKPFGQMLKENLLGDDDPTTQNFGEKVGSFLNKAGESATFGLIGDEASAAVESLAPGVDYETRRDHYRDQERVLERDNPGAALTAELGGAVLAPVGALGAVGKGAGIAKRVAASAAATGAMSGVYGAAEGEGGFQNRAQDAGWDALGGAAVGAAIPVAGGALQRLLNNRLAKRTIKDAVSRAPTTAQLRAQGAEAYKAIENAGVSIRPDRVRGLMDDVSQGLRAEGAGYAGASNVMPGANSIMRAADDVGANANTVPFNELDIFRRYAGNAARANPANRADARAVSKSIEQMDNFVANLKDADIDAGDIETLQTMLPKARETWARMSRSQTIDDAIDAAENYQSGKASGLANQFRRILNSPKRAAAFSDAEKKIMRRVVDGTMPEKIIRYMGSGLGMMGQIGVGAAGGSALGPIGTLGGTALGAATAAGSRKLTERIAGKNAETARAVIAAGGLPALPEASPLARLLTEQLLRQGSAASIHSR